MRLNHLASVVSIGFCCIGLCLIFIDIVLMLGFATKSMTYVNGCYPWLNSISSFKVNQIWWNCIHFIFKKMMNQRKRKRNYFRKIIAEESNQLNSKIRNFASQIASKKFTWFSNFNEINEDFNANEFVLNLKWKINENEKIIITLNLVPIRIYYMFYIFWLFHSILKCFNYS